MRTSLIVLALCLPSALSRGQAVDGGGLAGGGPLQADAHANCISPDEYARVATNIALFEAEHPRPYDSRGPALFNFYPIGGNWYRDNFMNNFVDLNRAASAILDWNCSDYTYDGHNGHDNGLRSFGEQEVGVPIFAALPGTVVDRHDGEPDHNTTGPNVTANYVVLSHGGARYTYYWHMRTGSVAVSLGQVVRAGQQLGLVGSSGYSTGPHLHFETNLNNAVYEPFAGACRAGASGFAAQYAIDRTFRLLDFGITPTDLSTVPGPPQALPRTGQLAFAERPHWFWMHVNALPANSTWRVRYIRPNGTQAYDSGTGNFGNNPYYRWSWWYWYYTLAELGTTAGTWRIRVDINGAQAIDAPVEVRATRDPNFNRPPAALTSLRFDPAAPTPQDVIFCRVDTSLVLDDPDYDIVRYTYVWTLDGVEVRRITSAGQADAIPASTAVDGQTLRCVVTPSDPRGATGPASTISYTFPSCPADFNHDGGVDGADVETFFLAWVDSLPQSDVNSDGGIDGADVESFFIRWTAGGC
ncbi:MAG: M23 family metallopeptidase [Planctomycetes bacterium]|nr:M23 family metallopeptidase [Planctomycetota bacterium]